MTWMCTIFTIIISIIINTIIIIIIIAITIISIDVSISGRLGLESGMLAREIWLKIAVPSLAPLSLGITNWENMPVPTSVLTVITTVGMRFSISRFDWG